MADKNDNQTDSFLKKNISYVSVKNNDFIDENTSHSKDDDSIVSVVSFNTNDTPKIAKQNKSTTSVSKNVSKKSIEEHKSTKVQKNSKSKENLNNQQLQVKPKYLPPKKSNNKPPINMNHEKMREILSESPSLLYDYIYFILFLVAVSALGFFSYGIHNEKLKNFDFYWSIFLNNIHVFSIAIAIGVYFISMLTTSTRFFYLITVICFNMILSKQFFDWFLYKINITKYVILIITNLILLVVNIFIFQYPYNYLISVTFQQNITSVYFSNLISHIFIPVLCLFVLLISTLTISSLFFLYAVNKFTRFCQVTLLCFFLNFLHTVLLGINITIISNKSKLTLIRLIPTLFKYSLLRPIYFLIGLLKRKEIDEEKTSFSNSFKRTFNQITSPIQTLVKDFCSTNLYFAMVFSVHYGVPTAFAIETTSKYIESDLYITNIKDVPFFRIFFPTVYSSSYILWVLLPETYPLSSLPLIFISLLLPDIVIVPFYYAVVKVYKDFQKEAIKLMGRETMDRV